MRQLIYLLFIGFCITFTSCREDFVFETSAGGLEFSKDTVYLDTVFSNIGSSTYTLKVYNRSNKDIKIPSIRLGEGQNSKYRLMVDGMPGKEFTNVELLAKDSMYVFIESTIDYSEYANNTTTFLYTDQIQFTSTNGTQNVELVTLVQDAYFLYPQRDDQGNYENVPFDSETNIYGFYLDEADPNNGNEYHWNNTKPYVIYGYATVPTGKTLTVDPGARVHFHADSGLMVRPGGRLVVNGAQSTTEEMENEVIFEGDRLEPDFADVAGQWGTVLIMSDQDNTINHLTLKNANIGIYAMVNDDSPMPKVTIKNSQLYNCTNFAMYGIRANITGENVVVNNAGVAAAAFAFGGTYNFKYCTFANYFNSYNQVPLLLNDYRQPDETTIEVTDLTANFDNCIVYGSGNIAMSLEKQAETGTNFHIKFNHSLIKVIDYNQLEHDSLYPFGDNDATLVEYLSTKIARTSSQNKPDFVDGPNNKLQLITGTDGEGPEGTADPAVVTSPNTDITGTARGTLPDMGAYESKPEE
ncbi:hypothetical protein ACLI1A_10025 [Flavobacterium sp. RHBU_3]|uniref:hypothetical protein n=1 Tax=Flavobacterium sp. RHBU_3 TaxID=3391184 RepID=UPI0039848C1A